MILWWWNLSKDRIMMKDCCDDLLICNWIKLYCVVIHTKVWYVRKARNVRICNYEMGKMSWVYSYPCEKWDWVGWIVSLNGHLCDIKNVRKLVDEAKCEEIVWGRFIRILNCIMHHIYTHVKCDLNVRITWEWNVRIIIWIDCDDELAG